jgi:hypothetical protein
MGDIILMNRTLGRKRGRPRIIDTPDRLARDLLINLCIRNGTSRKRLAEAFRLHPDYFRQIVRRVRQSGLIDDPEPPDAA